MTYTDEQLQEYANIQEPQHCELADICRELLETRKRIQQLEDDTEDRA